VSARSDAAHAMRSGGTRARHELDRVPIVRRCYRKLIGPHQRNWAVPARSATDVPGGRHSPPISPMWDKAPTVGVVQLADDTCDSRGRMSETRADAAELGRYEATASKRSTREHPPGAREPGHTSSP